MTGTIEDLSTGLNQGRWATRFGVDVYWVYSVRTSEGYNLIRMELAGTPRTPPTDFSTGFYLPIAGRTPSIAGRPGSYDWTDSVVVYVEESADTGASSPPFAVGASTGRIAVCFPGSSLYPVMIDLDGTFGSNSVICTAPCPWMDESGNVFVVFSAAPTTRDDDPDRRVWLAVWLASNRGDPDFLEQVDVVNTSVEAGNFPSVAAWPGASGAVTNGIVIWRKYTGIGTPESGSQIFERRFNVNAGLGWQDEELLSDSGYDSASDPAILVTEEGEYLAAYAATEATERREDAAPLSIYVRKLNDWANSWGPQYRVEAEETRVLCKYPQLSVGPDGQRFLITYEVGPADRTDLDGDGVPDLRCRGVRCAWALVADPSTWHVMPVDEGAGGDGATIDPQADYGDTVEVVPGSGSGFLYEGVSKDYASVPHIESVNPCIVPIVSMGTHDHFYVYFTNLDLDANPYPLSLIDVAGVTR